MCANLHVNQCVLGAHLLVNVDVREWSWLNVCQSTCESGCAGAHIHIHVNVGVREWIVRESTCESVCVGANIHVNVGVRD